MHRPKNPLDAISPTSALGRVSRRSFDFFLDINMSHKTAKQRAIYDPAYVDYSKLAWSPSVDENT
jgi:hypothetical protein